MDHKAYVRADKNSKRGAASKGRGGGRRRHGVEHSNVKVYGSSIHSCFASYSVGKLFRQSCLSTSPGHACCGIQGVCFTGRVFRATDGVGTRQHQRCTPTVGFVGVGSKD